MQSAPSASTTTLAAAPPELHPIRELISSERLAYVRRMLPGLAISCLLINLLTLALPLGILQIMDRIVASQATSTLLLITIGIFAALVLEELLRAANNHVTGWIGARYEHQLGMQALTRLMSAHLRTLEREEPGRHAERVAASGRVADFYSGQALLILFDFPFILLFLWVIYLIGNWVVFAPLALLLLFAYITVRLGSWLRQLYSHRFELDNRRFNFLFEVLGGLHTIKTHLMEAQMERRYELLQANNSDMTERLAYGNALANATGMLFSQVMIVGVVFSGAWYVLEGGMSPGGLAACMMLSVRALQPLRRSLTLWVRYQAYANARGLIDEIEAMPAQSSTAAPALPPVTQGIELRNVSIQRGDGNPLLDHVNLTIRAGECVTFQGDSGTGKSCLMRLIGGLDFPDSGEILVDGRPLEQFDADSVQRQIALIPETGAIFAGTILQNITMFDDDLNDTALLIAGKLGLDNVVATLKYGYETQLGEGSAEALPQGVRQLIAIARALAPNPSVILLDNANMSLDMESDRRLHDYLVERKGSLTLIMISHRPSYFALADHLYAISGLTLQPQTTLEAANQPAGLAIPSTPPLERPPQSEVLDEIVHRHFGQASDLANCLLPMLKACHWHGRPTELAEALPHRRPDDLRAVIGKSVGVENGMDLSGFCDIMAYLGFIPAHYSGSLAKLDSRLVPCLVVPRDKASRVVLERLADGRLRSVNGTSGLEELIEPDNQPAEIYLFKHEDNLARQSRLSSNWFAGLFKRFRNHILLALALTIFSTLLVLATPLFVRSVFDNILPTGDAAVQIYLVLGVLIALTLDFLLRRLKGHVIAHVAGRTEFIMGVEVLRRIINLPAAATEGATVNRQVDRIRNFEALRDFFVGPLTIIAFELPANVIIVAVLAIINPWSLALIACALLAYILLALLSHGPIQRSVAHSSQAVGARRELLTETVGRMQAIRSAGRRAAWLSRYNEISAKAALARYHDHVLQNNVSGAALLISNALGLGILALSAYETIQGSLTGGAMIATMLLVWRLTGPFYNLFMALSSIIKIRINMRQIENLMRMQSERDGSVHQTLRPPSLGAISFSRVSFRYTSDADPALIGINLNIAPRQLVVITGPNGAGKSTLLKMLERTHMPQAGVVRFDSIDIRQLPVDDLRSRITYMPQATELFFGTITQNLRLAHSTASDADIDWAIDMAGLREDIEALPDKMQTRISNSGVAQFPNGFLKRLSLARTILRPAAVALLDEPGSGLDEAGEEALLRCLGWLRQHATVLMVSHRPAHMRLADTVIYMERGAITAGGDYDSIKHKLVAGKTA